MRLGLLTVLLVTACLRADETSVSRSVELTIDDAKLTDANSPAYISVGECLIDVTQSLSLSAGSASVSNNNNCLPSAELSWLLQTDDVKQIRNLQFRLAILFDTSVSLKKQDKDKQRFLALRQYLMSVHKKLKDIRTGEQIEKVTAEIAVYPFKYCDQTKGDPHKLTIKNDTKESVFKSSVDTLIGLEDSKGNETILDVYVEDGITKRVTSNRKAESVSEVNLRTYGAGGSTNYLQSLAYATEFLNKGEAINEHIVKQVLIISDGLPFTYNDSSGTQTITDTECSIDKPIRNINELFTDSGSSSEGKSVYTSIRNCVTKKDLYPNKDSCVAPTGFTWGLSDNASKPRVKAFDDPRNHLLGMIQHSAVIRKLQKDEGFSVYAVHLNKCRYDEDKVQNFGEKYLCQHVSAPFFTSFTTGGEDGYFEAAEVAKGVDDSKRTDQVDNLSDALEKVLKKQLPVDTIAYHIKGVAYIPSAGKSDPKTEVDSRTILYKKFNRIKVGRDKVGRDKVGRDKVGLADGSDQQLSVANKSYDYSLHATNNTLEVEHPHPLQPNNKFSINYNFTFASDNATCRDGTPQEIYVPPAADGSIPVPNKLLIHRIALTGGTAWCLLAPLPQFEPEVTVDDPPPKVCKANAGFCCKSSDSEPVPVQDCTGGQWDVDTCSCSAAVVTTDTASGKEPPCPSQDCGKGRVWRGHPICECQSQPISSPAPPAPTSPNQDNDDGGSIILGSGNDNKDPTAQHPQPDNGGKISGDDGKLGSGGDDAKPQKRFTEGIIWGKFDSF